MQLVWDVLEQLIFSCADRLSRLATADSDDDTDLDPLLDNNDTTR